jgi:TonB family protein
MSFQILQNPLGVACCSSRASPVAEYLEKVRVLIENNSRIQKSDAEIFDQAAIDAAMQMVFIPAILHGEPVDVWGSIPFHFKLR